MKLGLFTCTLLLLYSCATIDLPPGGDKDITPPKIVSSVPDSGQLNFTGNQVKITFDEYFTTTNLASNLLVSPPFDKAFSSKIKGKTLTLTLPEELSENTTYQFYFGDAISDLNEGNKTKNLKLVFSTGDLIDTAHLHGQVLDAFSLTPIPDCKVFLFKEYADSQLITSIPYYISITDKEGHYEFDHIANEPYYLYAVQDKNNNNHLELDEGFAFLNDVVKPYFDAEDLLISTQKKEEDLSIKRLKQLSNGMFQITLTKPITGTDLSISSNIDHSNFSKVNSLPWFYGQEKDTLYCFVPPKKIVANDTFSCTLNYDTFVLKEDIILNDLKPITPNIHVADDNISPNVYLNLRSNWPIQKTNTTLFHLTNVTDSQNVPIDTLYINEANTINISARFKEGKKYSLVIPDEAITFFGNEKTLAADTLIFKTLSSEQTGVLEVNVSFDSNITNRNNYLLFIKGKKNTSTIESIPLHKDTVVTYNYLFPDTYELFVVLDSDKNKKWSPANYIEKRNPEVIWRLNSPIEVRTNWKTKDIPFIIK